MSGEFQSVKTKGRKWPAAVLCGLAWGVAVAVALYAIALWLLIRPLASSVADGWVDAVNGEPAGVAEEPAAAPEDRRRIEIRPPVVRRKPDR